MHPLATGKRQDSQTGLITSFGVKHIFERTTMATQNDPEPSESPFKFEMHTNHNVLPPSDEEGYGKTRIAPDILQFIMDQNEVNKWWSFFFFLNATSLLSLWRYYFEEPV